MLVFEIDGEPVPRREKIAYRRLIDERKAEKYGIKWQLKCQYDGELIAQAVKVSFIFYLKIPDKVSKKTRADMLAGIIHATKKPDCSNLQKLYEDCLTGIVLEDDRFVCKISSEKYWAESGKTIIKISTL